MLDLLEVRFENGAKIERRFERTTATRIWSFDLDLVKRFKWVGWGELPVQGVAGVRGRTVPGHPEWLFIRARGSPGWGQVAGWGWREHVLLGSNSASVWVTEVWKSWGRCGGPDRPACQTGRFR